MTDRTLVKVEMTADVTVEFAASLQMPIRGDAEASQEDGMAILLVVRNAVDAYMNDVNDAAAVRARVAAALEKAWPDYDFSVFVKRDDRGEGG